MKYIDILFYWSVITSVLIQNSKFCDSTWLLSRWIKLIEKSYSYVFPKKNGSEAGAEMNKPGAWKNKDWINDLKHTMSVHKTWLNCC